MSSVLRIVKREERECADKPPVVDEETAVQRSTPEMIVKSWIAASRERRRAETANSHLSLGRWKANLCSLGSQ